MAGGAQAAENAKNAAIAAPTTGNGWDLFWKIPIGVAVGIGSLVAGQDIQGEVLPEHNYDSDFGI